MIDSIMPAEDVFPALVQEIQPTLCAAEPTEFRNNPVCSLHTITVCFGSATEKDWNRLQQIVRTVEIMIDAKLLTPFSSYTVHLQCQEMGMKHYWSSVTPMM